MTGDGGDGAYKGACFRLLTQHGKEEAIAPPLRDVLGARLAVVSDFDTDTLGTFTRDVPRAGTQLEAARRKAMLAIERGGSPGLGSEGSILPSLLGIGSFDIEIIVCVDVERGIEVVGQARQPGLHQHGYATSLAELAAIARRACFPEHGLVLRPDSDEDPPLHKGLRSQEALEAAFAAALAASSSGRVFVENDLRAHQHPTRMATIAQAARDLVDRLGHPCPACRSPGFGLATVRRGLPCDACGFPTRLPIADIYRCARCAVEEVRPRGGPATADPGACELCNP